MSRTIRRPNGDARGWVGYNEDEFNEWKEWSATNGMPDRHSNWWLWFEWEKVASSDTYKQYVRRCQHVYHRDHNKGWARAPFSHKGVNRVYRAKSKDTLVRALQVDNWDEFLLPRFFKDEQYNW